ncbi:ABC transporter permease [Clostridium frigidicarnis]|uniref:Oligopeptide transport system permease protein n=1 Tax=Clostridium frigidicarnis TaxID=84698 RepID=A0A1I0VJB4_9CLOT|nr:ABC transporter permease [Clostridium frigidicarnis]SFA76010.1 oligopeptide transport system permease protein [Clostridium frigidicarnis]
MLKYIGKRLLASILTIWVIISLTFFLMRLMPGGPFDGEKITPEIRANLEVKYGLDKSLGNQYTLYMKNLLHGDLGTSMIFKGRDVADTIAYSFPASAKIGLIAVLCSLIIGVLLGVVAALNRGRWPDSLCMIIATLGITIPSFVIAALLIYVFTAKLKLLPATGFNSWKNCIMPVIALAGSSMAFITRLTRSRLLDVLKADYIRTARAKGLSNKVVIFKHALKNSLIPIVTYLGPLVAGVLTGSFVVEKIFAIPGLGNEFIQSVTNRDYSMLLGVTVFYCTLVIVCNFLVDIMYGFIDPRIKLENS